MLQHVLIGTAAMAMLFMLAGCGEGKSVSDEKAKAAQPQAAKSPAAEADATKSAEPVVPALLNFTMEGLDGQPVKLGDYAGKVVMFVNVASKCGYTKQYPALEELYKKYKDRGFVLVGVPANNFGGQEPGTNAQIAEFCTANYGVTFPMLAKVSVKGDDQCALYQALVADSATNGLTETGDVKWNFEKFLLDRQGKLVARFRSAVTPTSDELTAAVEKALGELR